MQRAKQPISEQIIQTVATTTNSDALELPPLYDAIDPDALDALVAQMSDGTVSFTYAGYNIVVGSDESVSLEDLSKGESTVGIAD